MVSPLLYTVEGAAAATGLGRTMLYSLIKSGRLRSVRIGASRRIAAVDLQAFIDELRAESADGA